MFDLVPGDRRHRDDPVVGRGGFGPPVQKLQGILRRLLFEMGMIIQQGTRISKRRYSPSVRRVHKQRQFDRGPWGSD